MQEEPLPSTVTQQWIVQTSNGGLWRAVPNVWFDNEFSTLMDVIERWRNFDRQYHAYFAGQLRFYEKTTGIAVLAEMVV